MTLLRTRFAANAAKQNPSRILERQSRKPIKAGRGEATAENAVLNLAENMGRKINRAETPDSNSGERKTPTRQKNLIAAGCSKETMGCRLNRLKNCFGMLVKNAKCAERRKPASALTTATRPDESGEYSVPVATPFLDESKTIAGCLPVLKNISKRDAIKTKPCHADVLLRLANAADEMRRTPAIEDTAKPL